MENPSSGRPDVVKVDTIRHVSYAASLSSQVVKLFRTGKFALLVRLCRVYRHDSGGDGPNVYFNEGLTRRLTPSAPANPLANAPVSARPPRGVQWSHDSISKESAEEDWEGPGDREKFISRRRRG